MSKQRNPQVVVAGHICLDVIPSFPGPVEALFEPGTLVEVGRPVLATGGAVSNVGLALHRLGVPTRLIGKVGDDLFGHAIIDLLQEHESSLTDTMIVSKEDASSYTIVLSPPGVDRTFFHGPGANDTFRPTEIRLEHLKDARILHFGYPPLLRETYSDGGRALASLFASAREAGSAVSLDMAQYDPVSSAGRTDWVDFLARVLPQVDLFGPSIGEMLTMLNRPPVRTLEEVAALGRALLDMGPAVVVLKLGADGLYVATSPDPDRLDRVPGQAFDASWCGRSVHHPCFDVRAVGTTGAGDCTLAGVLAAILRGLDPEATLRFASAIGACGVEHEDATSGVPSWENVAARLDAGWRTRGVRLGTASWRKEGDLRRAPDDARNS